MAAFAPDKGESSARIGKRYGPTPGVAELRPLEDGFLVLTLKGVLEDFAPDLTTDEKMTMVSTQAPTQGAALGSAISTAAWRKQPSWFVIAANDRMISPEQEKDSPGKLNAATLTPSSSHVSMLSKPKKIAEFISDAASGRSVPTPPEQIGGLSFTAVSHPLDMGEE